MSVQKCQLLAISENSTNVYACCSFKLIIKNECLVYIHSFDFALIIYNIDQQQGQFRRSWSLLFNDCTQKHELSSLDIRNWIQINFL